MSRYSLCQRLNSRQLTQKTSTKGERKIKREVRAWAPKARESAEGARDSAKGTNLQISGAILLQHPHKLG